MLSANAVAVLEKRYLAHKPGQPGVLETPQEMFMRVSKYLAEADGAFGCSPTVIEKTAERFNRLTYNLDFLPNSPTLANAGARTGQLSACFVLPVPDSLDGIFEAIKYAALTHQTGGGTGASFSQLRPKNDVVGGNYGVSSGPTSFMDVWNAATESIKQGGMRRGANMGILRIDHPDIINFITYKEDLTKLTNFNISVAVTDAFMAAVEAGTSYDLINPRTGAVAGSLDARTVFKDIILRAWHTGEPGLVFIDRMNRYCPVPWLGEYEATNPCGEQPLLPYESCNLGSINLENFVTPLMGNDDLGVPFPTGDYTVDWGRLRTAVHTAMHFLDNVIERNVFPIPQYKEMSDATRKIGLGVMGYARLLFKLGIPYGSDAALALAEELFSFIDYESKVMSITLAAGRGCYPAMVGHEDEVYAFWDRVFTERDANVNKHPSVSYRSLLPSLKQYGIRNSNTTTVAPTGTLSIIADTAGGCEPVFGLSFKRRQADMEMLDVDPVFEAALRNAGLSDLQVAEVLHLVADNHGSLALALDDQYGRAWAGFTHCNEAVIEAVLEPLAKVFVVAHDVTPEQHVLTQAAFQAYNDSATSKTINFPEWATPEDVEKSYMLAWETGCKGITVYRNNSRGWQPLSVGDKKVETPGHEMVLTVAQPAEKPCPDCGQPLRMVEGCEACSCGYSGCSYQPPSPPTDT